MGPLERTYFGLSKLSRENDKTVGKTRLSSLLSVGNEGKEGPSTVDGLLMSVDLPMLLRHRPSTVGPKA